MAYYYPEGYFGPICDALVSDEDIANRSRPALDQDSLGDPEEVVFNGTPPGWWDKALDIMDPPPPFWLGRKCKVRTLADGTKQYYDCEDEYTAVVKKEDPWNMKDIGLTENFFVPEMSPDSCSPFDPDINVRPIVFYQNDGTQVTKYKKARSSPVTYPVTSETNEIEEASGTFTANFSSDGTQLIVAGTGTGNILLKLDWDDNPNTNGVAVDTITVGGETFTRGDGSGGGAETGEQIEGFQVTPQTYNISYTGLHSANSPIEVVDSNQRLCLKDDDGNDCNANFRIHSLSSQSTVTNAGYWSTEGNKYGVWVNPMVCTLPLQPQTVTYYINICETATYGFTFGCDDNATLFLNDSNTPLLTAVGGIFAGGANATPQTTTTSLTAGTLKLVVNCTNSAAGFVDGDGKPTGLAYKWHRNPGGWYIKICKGGVCPGSVTSTWVKSGPHSAWSDFMDEYAVYPSNSDPLVTTTHTNTWNVTIPNAGKFFLEVQADNSAVIKWDGTSQGTVTSYTTSTTYTLTGVTAGNHTIQTDVVNTSQQDNTWEGNPGGVAFVLRDELGSVIQRSTNLSDAGDGTMIWNTRMATEYIYSTNQMLGQVVTGTPCAGDSACVVTEGITDAGYGTTKQGYLKMNDGESIGVGPYVTGYVSTWLTLNAKTGVTYQQLFAQLTSSYDTILSRKPDASGFDYWIHSFINLNPGWSLSDLNTAISASANGIGTNASNELAHHTAHSGVEGNYDECGTSLM